MIKILKALQIQLEFINQQKNNNVDLLSLSQIGNNNGRTNICAS